MKNLTTLLLTTIFIATFGFATVTVDGYALLENQTDHSGITVTFERTAPSALTETATTDANGLFTAQLETGIYDVTYTKDGYFSESITDQSFYANTTLSDLTLLEHTTLINVPSLFSTIQTAINYSSNGDTVLVQPGTYVENINYNGKNIVVGSLYLTTSDTSYISSTIIDGNQSGSVVTLNGGEDSTAVLTGLTITNGLAGSGGGIYISGASPTLTNLRISDNISNGTSGLVVGGGGLFCSGGPSLVNVIITGNSAENDGGGIYCYSSSPSLENVTVSGNSASADGGGIYCYWYSSPSLVNVTISGNSASDNGGGMTCFNNSSPSLVNVTISNNLLGGGIYCSWHSSPSLVNVTISNNDGTGISLSQSSPSLVNVTISKNGTGMSCVGASATPSLVNVTISNNVDGGIYCGAYGPSPTLVNTIVANNTGNYGIYVESGNPTITYSDFYNNENGNFYGCEQWVGVNVTTNANGDSCDAYYNIQEDPEFVDLDNNNYHLQNWSQLIGAGTITDNMADTDMDGNPRPNPENTNPDIGAYENPYGVPQYQPQVLNVPADYSSIQAGLTAANATDTVLVQPGTYTENIFWPETNGIKLISAGDSSNTIIDGGGVSSVIYMNPQTATIDTTTLIQGFKITNGGNVQKGGGFYINSASPKIMNLTVSDNVTNNGGGGGIYISNSNLILRNVTVRNNIADGGNDSMDSYGRGGGILIEVGSIPSLTNITVSDNAANFGGGIYQVFDSPSANFNNVIINNNIVPLGASGGGKGGGIYIKSKIYMENVSVINNTVTNGEGGGILWQPNGADTLSNVYISGNSASNNGGGISTYSTENSTITNVQLISNSSWMGGGMYLRGIYKVSKMLIYNNNAAVAGGGAYIYNGAPSIDSTIFVNNSSNNYGGGLVLEDIGSATYNFLTIINNTAINGAGIYLKDNSNSSETNLNNITIISNQSTESGDGILNNTGILTVLESNLIHNEQSLINENNSIFVDAISNYWGHSSGPYHPTQNSSGQGDSVNIFVNVDPWLTAPNTDAPPIPAQNLTVTGTGNDFISLNWDASEIGDLAGYKLYYDSDSSGYPYANSVDVGTETSFTLSSLTLGTTYYLAVTTYDTDGNESWYSNEVSGVTRVMQAQSLDIGGDEDLQHLIIHNPIITFGYYDSMNETQTSYQVQVSTLSDYSSADMWDSGEVTSSDTSVTYAGTTLADGVTYYLRAKVGAGSFYSDWSTLTFRMNTEPTTPVLASPINNQVSGIPVVLKVLNATDAESDAITYSFNVYSDVTLTTKLDSATAVAEGTDTTSWQITATLPDNGQYFWAVSTNDGYEESTVSTAASFLLNISNDAPAAFALLAPADSAEVTALSPLLDWEAASDPDPIDTVRYTLYYGTMIPDLQMVSVDTATSYQVSTSLSDNTTYYWKVVANDLNGASTENTGGYHSFRVNTANDLPGDFALLSPEDGSMVTDLTPTLHWEEPVDPDDGRSNTGFNDVLADIRSSSQTNSRSITSYYVYVDTTLSLTGVIPDTVTTNSDTPAVNLLEDEMYYWKVEAVDDDGGVTSSAMWSFWTNSENSAPSAITLLTPTANEETGLTPTFSWTASSDADLYDVIGYTLSYGSDPTSLTDVSTNSELTYTPDADLMDNTGYVWQVTATDQSGATYTTALQSFTVNSVNDDPGVFSLISPDSGSIVLELPPLLVWSPTTDLDGDSVLFDVQLNSTSIGMTHHNYYFVDGLAEDMTYTWSVIATDNNGGSTQSGTWSFIVNTENVPPTPFALLSPEPETVLNTQVVFFEWESATDADPMDDVVNYSLDIHVDTVHMHYDLNTTSFTSDGLTDNSIYHWSVTAHDMNGGTTVNTGGPRMFVINTANDPPSASTLVAPLNGSIQTDLTPNFYWTEATDPDPLDHVSYTMNWWPMGVLPVIYSINTDSTGVSPDEDITDNSQFGWVVVANDMHNSQSTSDSSYFYSDAFPEPPLNFATVSPINNVEGLATEVEFVWEETDDPDPVEEISYRVVYATNWEDSSTYVYSETIQNTSMVITLADNSQYYWLVEALDSDGFVVGSNENNPNYMVVGTLSIDGDLIPVEFALHQNYPNPFNPITTLRYDLPEQATVNIIIYDMLGREVKTLVNSTQDAGFKSVIWNATNDYGKPVSAGVYLYQIQAGDFRQTKKMVLLK